MCKVAVIGCGQWGKNLVRNFFNINALYCICDSDQERLKTFGDKYKGVKLKKNYIDVLKDDEVDGVVIATPAETHYLRAKEALLHNKDVFVEKPLSLHLEEGRELLELAKQRERVLMVGHLLEYHPVVLRLKGLVDSGELGKIDYIYSNRLNLGRIRNEENILWSFAPHDISVILRLLGEMPQRVSSFGASYLNKNIADVTLSHLQFQSGVQAHIFVSWLHPYKEQRLVVVGDKKMALFDDMFEKDKLLLFPHKIEWIGRIPTPRKENAEVVSYTESEPLKEECLHFIECIKERRKPRSDGEEGLKVLKILEACQESLEKNGSSVELEQLQKKNTFFVHSTASVDMPCEIGEGTKIWHNTHVMKGARIGRNCIISQNVFVGSDVVIGDNVKLQNNVSVFTGVTLEDGVFCGPSMVFTNVINPRCHISRKKELKNTLVKRGATLGANSTIVCGVTIGRYAFVGAGAVVTKDIPDHGLVYGNPAKLQGYMCECGIRLETEDKELACKVCGSRYNVTENGAKPIKLSS